MGNKVKIVTGAMVSHRENLDGLRINLTMSGEEFLLKLEKGMS